MQFSHSWQKILTGEKTQTRRLMQHDRAMARWKIGKTYAVQSARTKPTIWYRDTNDVLSFDDYMAYRKLYVNKNRLYKELIALGYRQLKIEILDIRREDVREISYPDVLAEGFSNYQEFIKVWCDMHDKEMPRAYPDGTWLEIPMETQVERWSQHAIKRPNERYQAWVLTFKVVK